MKNCPFKNSPCDDTCGLFIKKEELNELVFNRLKAIGVTQEGGICSLKHLALAKGREIFENTKAFRN